jgi:hypothetical protein
LGTTSQLDEGQDEYQNLGIDILGMSIKIWSNLDVDVLVKQNKAFNTLNRHTLTTNGDL